MKIQGVKGTRDFYPPVMAVRNFIVDGWKEASLRNGFEEYDGPVFEFLKMYQVKSGDEIVEQLFNFTDRGARHLAIRPEITPTLARMVNKQINALPTPIKWFSVPRLCRAERPQKGRLREFFQWNIDIIGVEDVIADADVIYCTIDYLRSLGLTPKDIKAKISSRRLLAAVLLYIGIPKDQLETLYPVLDKKAKIPAHAFRDTLAKLVKDDNKVVQILNYMSDKAFDELKKLILKPDISDEFVFALKELEDLIDLLELMGVEDYFEFDMSIVRGLAYYTGVVFEVHDLVGDLRAIAGGGRYDNLLADFGGPKVTGTGMGMGDCVLEILLREKGLLKDDIPTRKLDYFVACVKDELRNVAIETVAGLRKAGFAADFSYKTIALKKQLKQAAALGAGKCVIIGDEYSDQKKLVLKDMATGDQQLVDADGFDGR